MAKQYLAAAPHPVERVFCAAERIMHNDLRKSMKDSTLEHSLFARFNTLSFEHSLLRLRIASGCVAVGPVLCGRVVDLLSFSR